MARNTAVPADHDAPPVTAILARFIATHPSRGWSEAVDHEAHRMFINWVACAIGASVMKPLTPRWRRSQRGVGTADDLGELLSLAQP